MPHFPLYVQCMTGVFQNRGTLGSWASFRLVRTALEEVDTKGSFKRVDSAWRSSIEEGGRFSPASGRSSDGWTRSVRGCWEGTQCFCFSLHRHFDTLAGSHSKSPSKSRCSRVTSTIRAH